MTTQTIVARLIELNVSKSDANKAVKRAEPGLRQDPHIVYDPEGGAEQFAWSDSPVPVDPDAFFRGGRWPQVLERAAVGVTPQQRDLLRDRALEDPQVTDLTRVALAAVGVLPWPETDVVQRLTRRSGAGTALKDLAENVLARIRAAAVEQGRVDVLLFLVRAENTSRALTGLAKDINDLQPAAGLVEETLRSLHNDLGSRRTTGAQRTAILRRLPLLRTERQVGAALGLCAFLDAEREFSALIACLDSEQVLSLPDQVWAEVVGGLRRPAREHLAVVAESEALRARLLGSAFSG
ncbi:hypothetical protein LWF15_21495 [Kineosporia rhizophila]|uniref:hypothetical protein n=1 Tax=Kineosporia TaxID=49184 RepID=UPI001E5F35B1|nr:MULTISPECIES: hypothetical protein [Kineosporia]MCE0538073.1 hypothetical protein [Kineosporia rhizophila]